MSILVPTYDMGKALSQVSSTVSLNKAVDSIATVTADRSVIASAYGKPCKSFLLDVA